MSRGLLASPWAKLPVVAIASRADRITFFVCMISLCDFELEILCGFVLGVPI